MDLHQCLTQVKAIAVQAADVMKHGKIQTIQVKSDISNIVTDMDVKTQNFIIEQLSQIMEDACFFAEEKENQALSNAYTWIIDPIDGTTNYAYDFHHSCVSIALTKDKQPLLGVCVDPYLQEVFYALKGEGAYCNDEKLHVSDHNLSASLIMCGTSPYNKAYADVTFACLKELFLHGRDIRRSGSAVLDLCYLASGRVDAFYEAQLSLWDYAAAGLIVTEAGGILHTSKGSWGDPKPITIVAGNKRNIADLIQFITK